MQSPSTHRTQVSGLLAEKYTCAIALRVVRPSLAHLRLHHACHIGTVCMLAFLILGTHQLFTSLFCPGHYLIEVTVATVNHISKS